MPFNASFLYVINLANISAQSSSSLGIAIDCFVKGATLLFEATMFNWTPFLVFSLKYTTAAYAFTDESQNPSKLAVISSDIIR
jgi:hypothetical protein